MSGNMNKFTSISLKYIFNKKYNLHFSFCISNHKCTNRQVEPPFWYAECIIRN
jgi:hypothetical protein